MRQSTAKLFRYYEKHTKNHALLKTLKSEWPYATHKQKGQITTWMKKVVVSVIHVKQARLERNLDTLQGFTE